METYYKGCRISYSSNTLIRQIIIDNYGIVLKIFTTKGEKEGIELAKDYIDSITP
jgi:hypothetical protein